MSISKIVFISSLLVFLYQRKRADITEIIIFFLFQALKGVRLTSQFAIATALIVARGVLAVPAI